MTDSPTRTRRWWRWVLPALGWVGARGPDAVVASSDVNATLDHPPLRALLVTLNVPG